MANHHHEKWIIKTPLGFILIFGGIFFMYYSLQLPELKDRWISFGLIASFSVALGAFLLSSAAIHKMKSDLIKKQKARQQTS